MQTWIEEHLADCDACLESALRVQSFCEAWDNWTAKSHGLAALRLRVVNAVANAAPELPDAADARDLRRRLREWNRKWQGLVSAALKVVVDAIPAKSRLIIDGLEDLIVPSNAVPPFALGLGNEVRGVHPWAPPVANSSAAEVVLLGNRVTITVNREDEESDPPVVILIPPGDSKPRAERLKYDDATECWKAEFAELEPGQSTLVFIKV
jgi:hypothetical protein